MSQPSTRHQILTKADNLFYEGGFEATSFADIAAAVGISRGNFYHHFRSKDAILDAVIDLRLRRTQEMLMAWQATEAGPRGRILAFVRIVIANRAKIMAHGCPVGTLCSELAKLDHPAQGRATEIFGLFRDWLRDQFHALGATENAVPYALHLLVWSQGVAVMASAFHDEATIEREVEGIIRWLDARPDLAHRP